MKKEFMIFDEILRDLLHQGDLKQMDCYLQHGKITTLEHSVIVAYHSYRWSLRLHIISDKQSLIKGALLHDYYLYDWHAQEDWHRWHGFHHAKTACRNARKDYAINELEAEIIRKHMWPLTIIPPMRLAAWMVNFIDTISGLIETLFAHRKTSKIAAIWVREPMKILRSAYD